MATDPLIGEVIHDTHRVVRLIGHGGMGSVYEAAHVRLTQQRYALKVLHSRMVGDESYYARFQREAEIASGIGHRNIVKVIDFYETEQGQPCMVMELLEGEDLGQLLQQGDKLAPVHALSIVEQVGSALQAVHDQGVVHRDIKPANIFLLDEEGQLRVKVLDFGISKMLEPGAAQPQLTAEADLVGTPHYMSPEQCEGMAGDVDQQTDIFSLGTIAYQLLCGRLPFDAPSVAGVIFKICRKEPTPLSEHLPHIPPSVERVINRALEKDKLLRYQRVCDFVDELSENLEIGWGVRTGDSEELPREAPDTVQELPQLYLTDDGRVVERKTEVLFIDQDPPDATDEVPPEAAAPAAVEATHVLGYDEIMVVQSADDLAPVPSPPSPASVTDTTPWPVMPEPRSAPPKRRARLAMLMVCGVAVFALGAYLTLHGVGSGPQASGETNAPQQATAGVLPHGAPVTSPLQPPAAAVDSATPRAEVVNEALSPKPPGPVAAPVAQVRIKFRLRPTTARVRILGRWRGGGTVELPRGGKVVWFKVKARGHQSAIGSFIARRHQTIRVTLAPTAR